MRKVVGFLSVVVGKGKWCSIVVGVDSRMMTSKGSLRLSGVVRPRHYDLRLDVDLERFCYTGFVRIEVEVVSACEEVRLHCVGLELHSGSVERDGLRSDLSGWEMDGEMEMVVLRCASPLLPGSHALELNFSGTLSEKLEGFYRASYRNGRYMATTHFEPTDARKAFPCFDEPSFRASFSVTMIVPEDRSCVSNMPVRVETVDGGKRTFEFQKTPSMPTYLVAFVVGDLERTATATNRGIAVEVITKPGEGLLGSFALKTAAKCLDFFEDFFRIQYPLPKVSLVAIPDFPIGAMENWGCITFRETAILTDPKLSLISVRQGAASTICHELAHMWFGNLVTMVWWEHLWLKEGFATWASWNAMDHIYPDWKDGLRFVCTAYLEALRLDSLGSTHPVEVPVVDPGQINEAFDTISYLKAASVISMLADYVGIDTFRAALTHYLEKHQYGAATTSDLWSAIEKESSLPIGDMMGAWTQKAGYPVLSMKETSDGAVQISQSQFKVTFVDTSNGDSTETGTEWLVPIKYVSGSEPHVIHKQLLESTTVSLEKKGLSSSWYRLNPGRAGFFRVNYPPRVWSLFAQSLINLTATDSNKFPASDRAGLLADAFALARTGYLATTQALDILLSLKGETEYAVWEGISSKLYELQRVFCEDDEKAQETWCTLAKIMASPAASKLGNNEANAQGDHTSAQMLRIVYPLMVASKNPETLANAHRHYKSFCKDRTSVPREILHAVLSARVKESGPHGYEEVLALYRGATLNEEELLYVSVLGSAATSDELRLRTLELALDEVRVQDALVPIRSVASSGAAGRNLCWSWVQERYVVVSDNFRTYLFCVSFPTARARHGTGLKGHLVSLLTPLFSSALSPFSVSLLLSARFRWESLQSKFSGGSHVLPRLVGVSTMFCEKEKAGEVKAFFDGKKASGFEKAISLSIEGIEADSLWRERDLKSVRDWLERLQA